MCVTDKSEHNQFHILREKCLAKSSREFKARGKSVRRCSNCQLADYACICDYRPQLQSRSEFILLMHRNEVFKPTNTGRLIADVLPQNTHVACWSRTEPEPQLLALLKDERRRCFIVFPEGDDNHCATSGLPQDDKINTFILLDGTWKQGRRMLTLSRWLDGIAVLAFPETLMRGYAVRKSEHRYQLSTAEAGGLCLQLTGETTQANRLFDYFTLFNQHYVATRMSTPPVVSDLHHRLKANST